jgi:hypothetical protein
VSKGKRVFHHVCGEPSQEAAVKGLPSKDLKAVIEYAEAIGKTGFAATVFGLGALEVTRRFLEGKFQEKGDA